MRKSSKPLSFVYQTTLILALLLLLDSGSANAQQPSVTNRPVDPGPRLGPAGAGLPFSTLSSADLVAFNAGQDSFTEVEAVPNGLGPRFNADSCGGCHAQPAIGGSSPSVNPQFAAASRLGAHNLIPAFITQNGPVREARLRRNPDGSAAGGVVALFTIAGRADALGCTATQPNFDQLLRGNNLTFRIPTPVFGSGLMESIPDAALVANLASNGQAKNNVGIRGRLNTSGNDGTITRFGWKAQNKSLLIFAGEAYNVEEGITSELFPNERDNIPGCMFNGTPENYTGTGAATAVLSWADIIQFTNFMRGLAPPTPAAATDSTTRGSQVFVQVGCAMCHTPVLTSGASSHASLSNQPVRLYSDLAIHHMGQGLDDAVSQGSAGTDEFRTAPLWGVGKRLFLLHDGRAANLLDAIAAHASQGSESTQVINAYNALQTSQKQDLINFLRSL